MSDSDDKLVMMANQIAAAFRAQPGDAAEAVAAHMRTFWAPPMRARIIGRLEAGGAGLSPIAAAAVARLQAEAAARAAG